MSFARRFLPFVLATRRLPLLRSAYRAVYGLALWSVRRWARGDGAALEVLAHRGWAAGEIDPGISDLDLIVVARDLSGEAGRRWMDALRDRRAAWKRRFPFLGEIQAVEPGELEAYRAHGGVRGRDLGAGPNEPRPDVARLIERLHAHTRLCAWSVTPGAAPAETARRQVWKAGVDLLRYAEAAGEPAPGREAFAAQAGHWKGRLTDAPALLAHFHAEAARLADLLLEPARLEGPFPAPGEGRGDRAERDMRAERFAALRRQAGEALVGTHEDDVYRSYLIVSDAAASIEELRPVFAAAAAAWRGTRRTAPVILTETLWRLWSRLPYLEDPTRWMFGGDGAPEIHGAERVFTLGAPRTAERLRAPVEAELRRHLLATLRFTWRGAEGDPARVAHHLKTRVMGLRLTWENGDRVAFAAAAPLERRYKEVFDDAPPAGGASTLYPWADAVLRGLDPDA